MALSDYQMSYQGLTIGASTNYPLLDVEGLEEFTARSTDVTMPNSYGAIPGPAWVEPRVITLTIEALGGAPVVHTLESAFVPDSLNPDALHEFGVKLPDREELVIYARCDRRTRPLNNTTEYGRVEVVAELSAPDPRKYSAVVYSNAMSAYVSTMEGIDLSLGAGLNLAVDLSLGAGTDLAVDFPPISTIGDYLLVNAGNTTTYPVFTITSTGVLNTYRIENFTTGDLAEFTQGIGPGDTLVVDMEAFVTGNGIPVLYNGISAYSTWTIPKTPVRLIPGNNNVRFTVTSGTTASTALAAWQNAYL